MVCERVYVYLCVRESVLGEGLHANKQQQHGVGRLLGPRRPAQRQHRLTRHQTHRTGRIVQKMLHT